MAVRSWAPGKEISIPRGQWAAVSQRRKGVPSRASAMQNARIQFGVVRSRPGTSVAFEALDRVTSMFNWVTPTDDNLLIYQEGTLGGAINAKVYDLDRKVSSELFPVPTQSRALSIAPVDVWTYIAAYDVFSDGLIPTTIYDGTTTALDSNGNPGVPSHGIDTAFRGPVDITSWTAVDSGPGRCTIGPHLLGFVYQNRTGYAGYPTTSIKYPITAATNTSPSVLTVPGNNFADGNAVNITGAMGNTAINGTGFVTSLSGDTFTITDTDGNPVNGNGDYTGGGVIFNPIQIVLTEDQRTITVTVGLPPLLDGGTNSTGTVQAKLFLIMTRSDSLSTWYFVPTGPPTGSVGEQDVPYNQAVTLRFTANISDEDMASGLAGDTAGDNFLFLHTDADGKPPFLPHFVVAYGNRMCYGDGTTLWVSDPFNPQQIAADRNGIRMQNQRHIRYAFQLPGNTNLYLTGDRWMGYVTDNGDIPSTWPPPIGVSDSLGASFPELVCAATGGNYVWIVTEAGPYLYDGAFGEQPLTYLVSGYDEEQKPIGWNRVNWTANWAIQIKDDVKARKLYIAVPMDGASEPNFMFCIDYLQGKTFDTVDISIDQFDPAVFGSLGIVKEIENGLTNLWIGSNGGFNTVRRLDVTTPNDMGLAIDTYWESGLVRDTEFASSMVRLGAMDIWARGNAPLDAAGNPTFNITVYGPDRLRREHVRLLSTQGIPSALTPKPGISYMSKFDFSRVENYTVRFGTNAIDSWWELSMFRVYSKKDMFNR